MKKKLELPKSIDEILDNRTSNDYDLLIKNKDGSISHISPSSSKINYTINLDNIIYADTLNIITLEEGYLYHYTIENNEANNKTKITLYKETADMGSKETYDSNAKVALEYLTGGSTFFLKINNSEIREFANFTFSSYSSTLSSTISPTALERKYVENKKNLRILYYDDRVNEIYVSEEKNTSIYYYDDSSFGTIGEKVQCYEEYGDRALCYESIKKELTLPENYTVNNIKEVRITSTSSNSVKNAYKPLIIMNDMKVFYYNNGWKELEELSSLYKNDHVVKLITNKSYASTITVLCDDGYLYKYSTY